MTVNRRMALLYVLCFPNGKLYVGITTKTAKQRFHEHQKSLSAVGRAIRKYGSENVLIVTLYHDLPWAEACGLEQFYIQKFGSRIEAGGYNLTDGGEGTLGLPISDQARKAVAEANCRRRGMRFSKSHRQRIADALRERWREAEYREEHTQYNKRPSNGKKIAMLRRWEDPEYRKKMAANNSVKSEKQRGRHPSEETRRKMSESQKRRFA